MRQVRAWPQRLESLGLAISTGPVVPFRTEALRPRASSTTVPLLWMQHVTDAGLSWPLTGFRKPQHLDPVTAGPKLLWPNHTSVLLRRFSPKEQARRLTVAVLHEGALPGEVLGIENHLNIVHRVGGLAPDEAEWLAGVLRSDVVDTYFRVANGHTQVNATDLRLLPLPPRPHRT